MSFKSIANSMMNNIKPINTPTTKTVMINSMRGTSIGERIAPNIPASNRPVRLLTPSIWAMIIPNIKPMSPNISRDNTAYTPIHRFIHKFLIRETLGINS